MKIVFNATPGTRSRPTIQDCMGFRQNCWASVDSSSASVADLPLEITSAT